MSFSVNTITVGARSSPLSRKQVEEVFSELAQYHPDISYDPTWISTTGDLDRRTSLRTLDKTDFFTKEIEDRQLKGEFRISVHSAKDLPVSLQEGLKVVAVTKGVDPSDVLVIKQKVPDLPENPKIGSSCARRDRAVKAIIPNAQIIDIRGTIDERLLLVQEGKVDGVVMAKAALIRLGITGFIEISLEGKTAPLQGRLAVVALQDDEEMRTLFACMHHEDIICRD